MFFFAEIFALFSLKSVLKSWAQNSFLFGCGIMRRGPRFGMMAWVAMWLAVAQSQAPPAGSPAGSDTAVVGDPSAGGGDGGTIGDPSRLRLNATAILDMDLGTGSERRPGSVDLAAVSDAGEKRSQTCRHTLRQWAPQESPPKPLPKLWENLKTRAAQTALDLATPAATSLWWCVCVCVCVNF